MDEIQNGGQEEDAGLVVQQQLQEYWNQLADVDTMIQAAAAAAASATTTTASNQEQPVQDLTTLQLLRSDLLELIHITTAQSQSLLLVPAGAAGVPAAGAGAMPPPITTIATQQQPPPPTTRTTTTMTTSSTILDQALKAAVYSSVGGTTTIQDGKEKGTEDGGGGCENNLRVTSTLSDGRRVRRRYLHDYEDHGNRNDNHDDDDDDDDTHEGLNMDSNNVTSPDCADTADTAAITDVTIELTSQKRVKKSLDVAHKQQKQQADFEIPSRLIPLENDTEAELNRKRRAIKALKNKWREQKKQYESEQKQKSWQSFQKKKKMRDTSIFSTTQDGDAKVGVVSTGRRITDNGKRTRHKHA